MARIHNPSQELKRGIRAAEQALAGAERDGFDGIEQRIRAAATGSARLAEVLGSLADHGLSRRGAEGDLVPAEEVRSAVSATRGALGALAMATPHTLSGCYEAYVEAVRGLVAVAGAVRARGVALAPAEPDEWAYFQSVSTAAKLASSRSGGG